MQQITPKLGVRVVTKAHLLRRTGYGVDDYGRNVRMKNWDRIELPEPHHGVYCGRRLKSNGTTIDCGDAIGYKPLAYFEVWLIAYADNRDILVCLPSDVCLESAYERHKDEQQQQQ